MNVIKLIRNCKIIQNYRKSVSSFIIPAVNTTINPTKINKLVSDQVSMVTIYQLPYRTYSTNTDDIVDSNTYEKVCEETLESLCDYFEELIEDTSHLKDADVTYSSGVLTVNFGAPYGTYVINRQSPNRQIWLSSPTSGPKRYDFFTDKETWIYKHDNVSLHRLLTDEIKKIVKKEVNFKKCSYSFVS